MADDKRMHLGYDAKGKSVGGGYSGRAVRFAVLPPDKATHARDLAIGNVTEGTKVAQMDDMIATEGLAMMILAYTDPVKPEALGDAKWTTPADVLAMGELLKSNAVFTTKDIALLKSIYHRLHNPSQEELDAIMGGIVGVVD